MGDDNSTTMQSQPKSILFVCLGNICRSPLAEGVFRSVLAERGLDAAVSVASAGTGDWEMGSPPDPRSRDVAAVNGIDISSIRARQVMAEDFDRHELILAMDLSNLEELRRRAPDDRLDRVHLFLEYASGTPGEVPDPYFGGAAGFDTVYRMIRDASERLADRFVPRDPSPANSGQASSTT